MRFHPNKPKLQFNRPSIYISTSEPDKPLNDTSHGQVVFSVLVPLMTGFHFHHFLRCVDSVRDQKGKPQRVLFVMKAEVIVVYDELTPSLGSFIEDCKRSSPVSEEEKRRGYDCKTSIHLLKFLPNVVKNNRGAALNAAVKNATGIWVLPMDIMDQLHPYFFAEILLALDNAKGLNVYNPGKYNVIMPDVMDFKKVAWNWQPSDNTSNILVENMLHGNGLFLRTAWGNDVHFSEMMLYGWEDWSFWIKLEFSIGIEALIVKKPSLKYNLTHHRSGFCSINQRVCVALLELNNPCVYEKSSVFASFKVMNQYFSQKRKIWSHVTQLAHNENKLAKVLVAAQSPKVSLKKVFSNYHFSECVNDKEERCEVSVRRLNELASQQAQQENKKATLFHMIITAIPVEPIWKHLLMHVIVGVLDFHPEATLVIHTDSAVKDIFGEEFIGHFGSRIVLSSVYCEKYIAEEHGFEKISSYMQRYTAGRQLYHRLMSDYMRLLVLYAFGGIYLDTDLLLRQRVDHFRNSAALMGSGLINGAFMSFQQYNLAMKYCLGQIPHVLKPFDRLSIGAELLTSASKVYSYVIDERDGEVLFNVLSRRAFFDTHSSIGNELITGDILREVYNQRSQGNFGYHFRGSSYFFNNVVNWKSTSRSSALGYALEDTCRPGIMTCIVPGT